MKIARLIYNMSTTVSIPTLHPDFTYSVDYMGKEKQPLLVIDNYLSNAETLIDHALEQGRVKNADSNYPGLRAPAPELYQQVMRETLGTIICKTFSLNPKEIEKSESFYSMVATPADELNLYQKIPHFDEPHPNEIAVIHYLCSEKYGGTSFYRHRQTGFETIDTKRVKGYLTILEAELNECGLPEPPAYINGDTNLFERVASKDVIFNRVLMYRCTSLHSGNIPKDYAFDLNPRSGRFTITSFLHA